MDRLLLPLAAFLALSAAAVADEKKTRVFVGETDSWQVSGAFAATSGSAGGAVVGGARPQTVEVMRTFGERCSEVIVTLNKEKADYVVLLDHEGGKGALRKDNKFAVFDQEGDMIASGSTRSLGNAVKDACKAIAKDSGGS